MNIFVGNLALGTTEDEVRREFAAFGQVLSVTLMNDEYIGSGQPRGYGYVEMPTKSDGATAIASLDGKRLGGRAVNVVAALPLSPNDGVVTTNTRGDSRFHKETRRR